MKRCPQCRKDYIDDSLLYCLDDGAALLQGTVGAEPATAILSHGSDEGVTRALAADRTGRVTLSLPSFVSRPGFAWLIAGILGLGLLMVCSWMYYRAPAASNRAAVLKFNIAAPKDETFGESLVISPDGRRIAFAAQTQTGETSLWVRSLDDVDAIKLAGTEGAEFPFWSPDSRFIGFFAQNKLKKVDANGGPPQALADAGIEPRGGAWSTDGTIIFTPLTNTALVKVSSAGGETTQLTNLDRSRGDTSHRWPTFLPDGRHYLYYVRSGKSEEQGIVLGSLDGGDRKLLIPSRVSAAYAKPASGSGNGRLLYVRDGVLLAQEFDTSKFALIGDPMTIAPSVQSYPGEAGPTALQAVTVSDTGILAFRAGSTAVTQLRWVDRAGKAGDPLVNPGIYHEPVLSPDGKRVGVSVEEAGKGQDAWTLDLTRGVLTRLTFDPALDGSVVWSPDGQTMYFASNRSNGKFAVFKKSATGVGSDELVYQLEDDNLFPDGLSPNGRWLAVDRGGHPGERAGVRILDLTSQENPQDLIASTGAVQHCQFSPDGKWVSYSSDESGRSEVYVQPFPATGGKWQISTAGGDQSIWNRNSKEIFYLAPDHRLISVPITLGPSFQAGQPVALFTTNIPSTGLVDERANYAVAPDGQRFLINGLVDAVNEVPITVFTNWETALKK